MKLPHHDRDLATRYLLGFLPEAERERISDRLFSDEEFAEELEAAEHDLLDAFAQGTLSVKEREAVQSRLLTSERQREKLRFAQALATRVPQRNVAAGSRRYLLWAAVVLIVFGVTGLWFTRRDVPRTAPLPPVAVAPVPKAPAQPPVFAVLLVPGATRGSDVQQLVVPHDATLVRLDLQLPNAPAAKAYSVRAVRQRETVIEQTSLSPHVEAGVPVLSVTVPSAKLTPGSYRLTVAVSGGGDDSVYYFNVR